jgi:trigger factor
VSIKTVENDPDGLKRNFMLTIPASDIEARIDQEVKRIAPQVRMPGFRPGKVPSNLVKKMHGEALRQDALNGSVQAGVEELLVQTGIRPAVRPEVSLQKYEPGDDAEIAVAVEALPVVAPPKVDDLKIDRLTVETSDAEVEEQLARLAGQGKRWTDAPKKHAAALGDLVVMDFAGSVAGKPFEGGTGTDMSVELGTGRLIPGFEDQLVGAKTGDERTVTVTFPDNYPVDNLKGKDAEFAVSVTAVRIAGEQKVDDEFAKTLGLTDLDQLRSVIKDQMQQELNTLVRTHMKRQLLDILADRHDFAVPVSMVDAEYENILAQLRQEAAQEEDAKAAMAEIEKDADAYRRIAERRVRLGLLLSEIGAINGVEVTAAEMQSIVAHHARQFQGEDRERFLRMVEQDSMFAAQLRAPLYEDKVVDYLFSTADVTEIPSTREKIEAELESEEGHVHGPDCGHDHGHHAPAKGKAKATKAAKPAKADKDAKPAKAEAPKPAKPLKKGPSGKPAAKPAKVAAAKAAPKPAKAEAPKPAKPVKDGAGSKPAAKAKAAPKAKAEAKPAAAKKPVAKKAGKKG